jgi:hypothetical protein
MEPSPPEAAEELRMQTTEAVHPALEMAQRKLRNSRLLKEALFAQADAKSWP